MTARIDLSQGEDIPAFNACILPVSIKHNGKVNAVQFFGSTSTKENYMETNVDVRYFRGIKLMGRLVDFDSKKAYVLNDFEILLRGDNDEELATVKHYQATAKIETLKVYGHDSIPPEHDKWILSNEWGLIADVLHSD